MSSNNIKLLEQIVIEKDKCEYKHDVKSPIENIFIKLQSPRVSGYDALSKINYLYEKYIKKYII